jgi:hypothetical protein
MHYRGDGKAAVRGVWGGGVGHSLLGLQQTIDFNQGGGEIDHKSPRGASLLPCYLRAR